MSETRALTNMVGNAVATLAVARWEGQLDLDTARRMLGDGPPLPSSATDTTTPPPGAGEGAS
jgi:aerobic C4-dicarboxylate transport protein